TERANNKIFLVKITDAGKQALAEPSEHFSARARIALLVHTETSVESKRDSFWDTLASRIEYNDDLSKIQRVKELTRSLSSDGIVNIFANRHIIRLTAPDKQTEEPVIPTYTPSSSPKSTPKSPSSSESDAKSDGSYSTDQFIKDVLKSAESFTKAHTTPSNEAAEAAVDAIQGHLDYLIAGTHSPLQFSATVEKILTIYNNSKDKNVRADVSVRRANSSRS
ncbi:MAG: hypothetical protein LC687_07725, partial [Actinobacteria bacterium]|nr:hypothetical protein [Actinomycetota bacterium]